VLRLTLLCTVGGICRACRHDLPLVVTPVRDLLGDARFRCRSGWQVVELTKGGSHGVLCLAASAAAFRTAIAMTRSNGTVVCVGLPPGDFGTPVSHQRS
jgi:threonine dehydrogenase-like Zn-dependent dehydrogenase